MNSNLQARRKVILGGCTLLFILSVSDGILTVWGLGLEAIEEVNPLMQSLIKNNPLEVLMIKSSLPVILGFLLWRIWERSYRFVTYALELLLIVYGIVMVLHVYWIIMYFGLNRGLFVWNEGL